MYRQVVSCTQLSTQGCTCHCVGSERMVGGQQILQETDPVKYWRKYLAKNRFFLFKMHIWMLGERG